MSCGSHILSSASLSLLIVLPLHFIFDMLNSPLLIFQFDFLLISISPGRISHPCHVKISLTHIIASLCFSVILQSIFSIPIVCLSGSYTVLLVYVSCISMHVVVSISFEGFVHLTCAFLAYCDACTCSGYPDVYTRAGTGYSVQCTWVGEESSVTDKVGVAHLFFTEDRTQSQSSVSRGCNWQGKVHNVCVSYPFRCMNHRNYLCVP